MGKICTISDILEYSNMFKISGVIALIDFKKAFDTDRWEFLYETLKSLEF